MSDVNHTDRAHALLSASGASRWLNCTPSARLEEKQQQSGSSVYAREGTLAHELADLTLRYKLGMLDKKIFNAEVRTIEADDLYTEDMPYYVDMFVDVCLETHNAAVAKYGDATALVEEKLDYSHVVEKGFGTGDFLGASDHIIEVIDLKYGKGVMVDARDNAQLKMYGLGALPLFDMVYDITHVKLTIVQPRLDHYSTQTIPVQDLLDWAENEVKPKAKLAYKGEGTKYAGEWCGFCKVKGICETLAQQNLNLAKHEFKDPDLLTVEDLAAIKSQIPMLVDWAAAVDKYMLKEALAGNKIPGYKVVEGRSQRKWIDEDKVKEKLKSLKHPKSKYVTEKLGGIGQIEKLVGKANINKLLGEFIVKPPGKPTLALESDPRTGMGIEQAQLDFDDDFSEDK